MFLMYLSCPHSVQDTDECVFKCSSCCTSYFFLPFMSPLPLLPPPPLSSPLSSPLLPSASMSVLHSEICLLLAMCFTLPGPFYSFTAERIFLFSRMTGQQFSHHPFFFFVDYKSSSTSSVHSRQIRWMKYQCTKEKQTDLMHAVLFNL